MITIRQPFLKCVNNRWYVYCTVIENGLQKECFWGGVEEQYKEYLLTERSDAYVIGLLSHAMRTRQDIECEAPITEELLYNIRQYLIPLVVKYGNNLHAPQIIAQTDSTPMICGNMVGASASCGVDSFNTICNQYRSPYPSMNITHLCLNDVGAYNECYGSPEQREATRNERYARGREMAAELGLPVLLTESNFYDQFPQNHLCTNTYSSMYAVFNMRKAWRVYYYSSAYHDIGLFSLFDNECKDTSYYDLLTLNCFSTDGIRIYSEGGERTRFGKIQSIANFSPVQKYIHVCTVQSYNCGICPKCRRTLLCIDLIDRLDVFSSVFDVNYYRNHRWEYYDWFLNEFEASPLENQDMYDALLQKPDFSSYLATTKPELAKQTNARQIRSNLGMQPPHDATFYRGIFAELYYKARKYRVRALLRLLLHFRSY